jgi:6-pyruvoyltetrahydropterin/6-carboxytetrahydropterin synthase
MIKKYDHANLNDIMDENPTAENIARRLCELIPFCYEVEIEETKGSKVRYVKGE